MYVIETSYLVDDIGEVLGNSEFGTEDEVLWYLPGRLDPGTNACSSSRYLDVENTLMAVDGLRAIRNETRRRDE